MLKSKTFWTGITGLIGAVSGFLTGDLEIGAALNVGVTSILAIFVRHSVSKVERSMLHHYLKRRRLHLKLQLQNQNHNSAERSLTI